MKQPAAKPFVLVQSRSMNSRLRFLGYANPLLKYKLSTRPLARSNSDLMVSKINNTDMSLVKFMATEKMKDLLYAYRETTPVSYTHLDVYKRQVGSSSPFFTLLCFSFQLTTIATDTRDILNRSTNAVNGYNSFTRVTDIETCCYTIYYPCSNMLT